MTQDTFVRLVCGIAEEHGKVQNSVRAKVVAVARKYSDPLNVPEAMQELRGIFGNMLDRHGYAALEKTLTRY